MVHDPFAFTPATQLAAMIRAREISPVELMRATVARAESLDPVLNAICTPTYETALARAREAAETALRRLNVDAALWDVDCAVLSGGERQRINIAAGTVAPPRLLLLDEPVSALDPANRERAMELIANLTTQGVAVLSVFHDMAALRRLATRAVFLSEGRIVAEGPAEKIAEVAA